MRPTIAWLRTGLLFGGGVLVVVLLGILGWAHFRVHQGLRNLPGRLGADIQREANGFTYSQTAGGRIIFTLHAKRATQHRTGQAELDDAGLVLYGENNGRADRIYGRNFLYDQRAGVVKAVGTVRLDLAAPAPTNGEERIRFASGGALPAAVGREAAQAQTVQATTSGLVYTQSTETATTAERVQFTFRGVNGEAEGAIYEARDGSITLEHAVRLVGQQDGRSFSVTASRAVLHRAEGQVFFSDADVHLTRDAGSGEQEVRAAQLTLRLGREGGVGRAEGSGGVELRSAEETVSAPMASLLLRRGSVPESLQMRGGVQLQRVSEAAGERVSGTAQQSETRFDEQGRVGTEQLLGGVNVMMTRGDQTRQVTGQRVDLALTQGQDVREAKAEGGAVVKVTDRGGVASSLGGDRLVAEFTQDGGATGLERVTAFGGASLRREEPELVETSRAGRIEATFQRAGKEKGAAAISNVVEDGGVVLDRELRRAKPGEVVRTHATARTASYDAASQRSVLTGAVEVTEPDRVLKADRIAIEQKTGDAEAEGEVQASLFAQPGKEPVATSEAQAKSPVHVVGNKAVLQRGGGRVTVFGERDHDARVWEGASQVQAPVLLLKQAEGTIDAYGADGGEGLPVQAVLPVGESNGVAVGASSRRNGVVRVSSGRMHFVNGASGVKGTTEESRRVEFSGGVVMRSADGSVRARQAVATLRAKPGAGASGVGMGELERVVAQGGVTVEQPGRVATGEELVWTAADATFLLTGTPSVPPEVTDGVNGRVTGGAIRFRPGDSSVVVTGTGSGPKGGRVKTETRLQEK